MPVLVKFPDGSEREVESYTKLIPSKEHSGDGQASMVQVPIEDDDWAYTEIIGGFMARAKR